MGEPELAALGRARAERLGFACAGVALAALGFLPQFGGPGYEAALAAGVVLPATAAVTAAVRLGTEPPRPLAAFTRGVQIGLALAVIGLGLVVAHGLRVGFCDALEGIELFALGPGFGAVLGGVTGAFAALGAARLPLGRRARVAAAVGLALAGPLGGVFFSLVRFYTSPMVFAYDPYFGYFSGPLYDTVIGSLEPLVTYRLGTLATLTACGLFAALLAPDARRLGARPVAKLAFATTLAASGAMALYGPELGHFQTAASIERALGRRLSVGRCDIVHSSAVVRADAARLGAECDAHLGPIERYFGARGPERVRVYLFASDAEKGYLMGAARTYIAKPWREEVYVQAAGYPHPVLGHELAHVVAGAFGAGPFRVAGPLGGLVPDPGRIEGVAMAAAPDENDALTLEEWAAAMLRLGLLPELEGLFRFGFFGHNAAQAYTVSGAFIRFLGRERGAEAVRRWYGGERLSDVYGAPLPEIERRFRAALAALPLSEAVLATARARFDRPAFFARRCPRVVDRALGQANARLGAGDLVGAREGYAEVLRLDARDSGARFGLAACAAREGALDGAAARFGELATAADAAPWVRLQALEARADTLVRLGRYDEAARGYAELAARLADEDRLRTLDVKRLAASGTGRDAIVALLVGDALGPSWDVAAPKLGAWSATEPEAGLADYLVGRNLVSRGRFRSAAEFLDRALARRLPEPRVRDEALRLRAVVACAERDVAAARSALERLFARPVSTARREALTRFGGRCGL